MEKEQKKLLLVAVSVGVFLLVTITVALIILMPRTQSQDIPFFSSLPFQKEKTKQDENVGSSYAQPVINNSQETNIIIDGKYHTPVEIEKTGENSLTIQIPRPSTAAVPDTPEITVSTTVTNPSETKQQTTVTSVTTISKPASTQSASQTAPASRAPTSSRTTAPAKTTSDYWIQIGAFSAKIRAEDAKELLDSRGLTSIIDNREIDGRIWYRVRLGPFTTENEANYWLALVKTLDGFKESQVRQTIRQL